MSTHPMEASEIRRFDRRSATRDYFHDQTMGSADNLAYVNAKSKDYKPLHDILADTGMTTRQVVVAVLAYVGMEQHEIRDMLDVSRSTIDRDTKTIKTALKQGVSSE